MGSAAAHLARKLRLLAGAFSTDRDEAVRHAVLVLHDLARDLEDRTPPAEVRTETPTGEEPAVRCPSVRGGLQCEGPPGHDGYHWSHIGPGISSWPADRPISSPPGPDPT